MDMAHRTLAMLQAESNRCATIHKHLHSRLRAIHIQDIQHNQVEDIHHYQSAILHRAQEAIRHKALPIIS
jgi:hypothetical protein